MDMMRNDHTVENELRTRLAAAEQERDQHKRASANYRESIQNLTALAKELQQDRDTAQTKVGQAGIVHFNSAPWEDGEYVITANGEPVGCTVTAAGRSEIVQWVASAWAELIATNQRALIQERNTPCLSPSSAPRDERGAGSSDTTDHVPASTYDCPATPASSTAPADVAASKADYRDLCDEFEAWCKKAGIRSKPQPIDFAIWLQKRKEEDKPTPDAKAEAVRACRAHLAWELAESDASVTNSARMELCNYAQWLTRKALGAVGPYSGVPHIFVDPSFSVQLQRCDTDMCERLVTDMLARAARLAGLVKEDARG